MPTIIYKKKKKQIESEQIKSIKMQDNDPSMWVIDISQE